MFKCKVLLALALFTLLNSAHAAFPDTPGSNHIVDISLPDVEVEDFVYIPTPEGYRYSYTLEDGSHHEELAYIIDPNSPAAAAYIAASNARRNRPHPRGGKNRKLALGALKSAAG